MLMKKCGLTFLLLPVLASLVSGCMWGVVRNAKTGTGVEGATITYTDAHGHTGTTTSGPGGFYQFDSVAAPPPGVGPVNIQVSAPGFATLDTTRIVRYDDNPSATPADLSTLWEVESFDLPLPFSLEQKIGQMIMVGVFSTQVDPSLAALIRDQHVGGVAFVGDNFTDPAAIRDFTSQLQSIAVEANGTAMLIAADQEGGCIRRLLGPFSPLPSAQVLGATGDPALVEQAVAAMAQEMDAVAVNQDLAPVLGLDVPGNPIISAYERSFGATPALVSEMGEAFIKGLHDANVIATIKHFPGQGSTTQDSHLVLPVVTKSADELRTQDMAPFIDAIQAGGVDVVMTADVLYMALDPNRPASLSAPITTGILRSELGFNGVVMTDDLTEKSITDYYTVPEAAELAVQAGADMFIVADPTLAPAVFQQILSAVQAGRISPQRIDESFARLQALKGRYGLPRPGETSLDVVGSTARLSLMTEVRQVAGISSICP